MYHIKFVTSSHLWTILFKHVQYSWQHTLINSEHLKGSAFNTEVLLGVVNHVLMISFITLTCRDGQQLNKQYDHNDFQVDVPDSIGVNKINLSMYVWFVTLVTFYLVEIFTYKFLAHLTQRVMWAIAITWRPSYVVNFFKNLLLWKY